MDSHGVCVCVCAYNGTHWKPTSIKINSLRQNNKPRHSQITDSSMHNSVGTRLKRCWAPVHERIQWQMSSGKGNTIFHGIDWNELNSKLKENKQEIREDEKNIFKCNFGHVQRHWYPLFLFPFQRLLLPFIAVLFAYSPESVFCGVYASLRVHIFIVCFSHFAEYSL